MVYGSGWKGPVSPHPSSGNAATWTCSGRRRGARDTTCWKRPPPPVTMRADQDMRLLQLQDGKLGLSVSRENEARLELWCLEDYQNEVWVLKHRIHLALQQQMPALQLHGARPWIPAVVSAEGDVLIESRRGLFHCDRGGNLLHRFWFNQAQSSHRVLPIRHVLRRSFRRHPMFTPSQNAVEPPFFVGWIVMIQSSHRVMAIFSCIYALHDAIDEALTETSFPYLALEMLQG